jgi:hypothetical protein
MFIVMKTVGLAFDNLGHQVGTRCGTLSDKKSESLFTSIASNPLFSSHRANLSVEECGRVRNSLSVQLILVAVSWVVF